MTGDTPSAKREDRAAGPAVIFDFDGVIADSESLHLRAFQQALASRGWTLSSAEYYDQYLGFSDRDMVEAFTRDRGAIVPPEDIERLLSLKEQTFARMTGASAVLCPGAEAAVCRLFDRFTLAIASGALSHEIVHVLNSVGLRDRFAAIVGADDVVAGKPAPDAYLEAARRIGVAPAHCVGIEDSPWGLESARQAGLRTIAVTHSYPASKLGMADAIVASLDDISIAMVSDLLAR